MYFCPFSPTTALSGREGDLYVFSATVQEPVCGWKVKGEVVGCSVVHGLHKADKVKTRYLHGLKKTKQNTTITDYNQYSQSLNISHCPKKSMQIMISACTLALLFAMSALAIEYEFLLRHEINDQKISCSRLISTADHSHFEFRKII